MKALVVYDSVFGNTEKVAQAIAHSLGAAAQVDMRKVGEAQPGQLAGYGLLVVGSPTRAFRATPATSAFLRQIPAGSLAGVKVTAFDTRVAVNKGPAILRLLVSIFGYAAEPTARSLQSKGGALVVAPAGFIVEGTEGPLPDGELERAADWARQIAAQL